MKSIVEQLRAIGKTPAQAILNRSRKAKGALLKMRDSLIKTNAEISAEADKLESYIAELKSVQGELNTELKSNETTIKGVNKLLG